MCQAFYLFCINLHCYWQPVFLVPWWCPEEQKQGDKERHEETIKSGFFGFGVGVVAVKRWESKAGKNGEIGFRFRVPGVQISPGAPYLDP